MHFAFELVTGGIRPRPPAAKPPAAIEAAPAETPLKSEAAEQEKQVAEFQPKKRKSKKYWTKEEDEILVKLVNDHGEKKWASIAKEMPGRTSNQLRTRYYNYLAPGLKNGPWSQAEDEIFLKSYQQFGRRWRQIARQLPGRSEMSIMLRCKHFFPELFRPASKSKKPRREDGVAVSALTVQAASDESDAEEDAEQEAAPRRSSSRRPSVSAVSVSHATETETSSRQQSLPGPSHIAGKPLQALEQLHQLQQLHRAMHREAASVGSALSAPGLLSHPLLGFPYAGAGSSPLFHQQLFGSSSAAGLSLAAYDTSRFLPPPRFVSEERFVADDAFSGKHSVL
eukprot:tig00000448_g858.t1